MKCLLPLLLFLSRVTSLQLTINPKHLDVGTSGASFRVRCLSDVPLTHCQFKWRDIYNNDGPLMDLSEGLKTPIATNYSYLGNGLEKGECGIELNRPPGVQRWTVCCRVRSKDSGWHYAHMSVFAHSKSSMQLTTSARQITVQPGENVTIMCNSSTPLLGCAFRTPDLSFPNCSSGPSSLSTNSYRCLVPDLKSGQCGISLYGVSASNNGFLWCRAWKNSANEWQSFALTVADSPDIPVLEVKPSNYSAGDTVSVRCSVKNALPTADVTWYLDTKIIRNDFENEAYVEPWVWPFQLQTIKQTVTLKLESGDGGKNIKCVIKQSDSGPEVQSSYTIAFSKEYKLPDSIALAVTSNKLIEGDILSANCTVNGGYPLPEVRWMFGSRNLTRTTFTLNSTYISESVSVAVQGEDDGQMLKCVIYHPHSLGLLQRISIINVECAPRLARMSVEQLKSRIGSPGVATVEIISNPKPIVYWTVDDTILQEGSVDTTGSYEAAYLIKSINNSNAWISQLYINNVTMRDFKTNFFLNARNKYGEEYFRCLNFSTTTKAAVIGEPKVQLSPVVDYFSVGTRVNATCTVATNRAVVSIKWLLSNLTLTGGTYNSILSTDPQGKHIVSQTVTFQVGEGDDGSLLMCSFRNKGTQVNISVMYPPKKLAPTIQLYGYQVNQLGVIAVDISANPRPVVMWEVGGIVIREDELGSDTRLHAPPALFKAHGQWIAKLIITNITQQDIASDFALTARNKAGSRTYHVRISTSEPSFEYQTRSKEPNSTTQATLFLETNQTEEVKNLASYTKSDTTPNKVSTSTSIHYTTETVFVNTQVGAPQERKTTYASSTTYSYLSIGNSVAIVALCILGSLVYRHLTYRLLLATQGVDRAPLCLENLYYDQENLEKQQTDCA